jgi:hypothetical protein
MRSGGRGTRARANLKLVESRRGGTQLAHRARRRTFQSGLGFASLGGVSPFCCPVERSPWDPGAAKKKLASTLPLPFREVVFDSIKAVRYYLPVRDHADVKAWRIVAAKSLGR